MAHFWTRIRMAASVVGQIMRAPDSAFTTLDFESRANQYAYLWAWESGALFTNVDSVGLAVASYAAALRAQLRLYRHTRLVWNMVPVVTDFWGSVMYPGELSRDGKEFPDGQPSALPLPEDTRPDLMAACAQVWSWTGMQAQKYVIPYWAAVAGNVLIEVVADPLREKVYFKLHWPSVVRSITLNSAGDVKHYRIEYNVREVVGVDAQGREQFVEYTYGQEVDKESIKTYRDNRLYDYTNGALGAEYPNPWGFVPACWVPHRSVGSEFAAPAVAAPGLNELLAINSVESMVDDAMQRGTRPIPVFFTNKSVRPLYDRPKRNEDDDEFSEERLDDDADRESWTGIKLSADSSIGKLDPSIDLGAADTRLESKKRAWLRKYPEVSMWESLRERNVSGVAAEILHGDTRNKVLKIRPETDRQVIKATQMAITIAARLRPTWSRQDGGRQLFAPFNEGSWDRGDLDFELANRPIIPEVPLTEEEKATIADIRLNKLGLPEAWVFAQYGVPLAVIQVAERESEARAQAQAEAEAAAREAEQRESAGETTPGQPAGAETVGQGNG